MVGRGKAGSGLRVASDSDEFYGADGRGEYDHHGEGDEDVQV